MIYVAVPLEELSVNAKDLWGGKGEAWLLEGDIRMSMDKIQERVKEQMMSINICETQSSDLPIIRFRKQYSYLFSTIMYSNL